MIPLPPAIRFLRPPPNDSVFSTLPLSPVTDYWIYMLKYATHTYNLHRFHRFHESSPLSVEGEIILIYYFYLVEIQGLLQIIITSWENLYIIPEGGILYR